MFWKKNWQNHETPFLILAPFLSEAVEANLCYFFKNWLMKLKYTNLLKPLVTIIHKNHQFFYLSEPIYFALFNVRQPVMKLGFNIVIFCRHPAVHAFLLHIYVQYKSKRSVCSKLSWRMDELDLGCQIRLLEYNGCFILALS